MDALTRVIKFPRYILSGVFLGKRLRVPFRDEYGKTTVARYKIVEAHCLSHSYIAKLDGRSIRYMRRAKIIENKREDAKRWTHL